MPVTWNRDGSVEFDSTGWSRALAHELGHSLLFLLDNYLGVADDDSTIIKTDCIGSAMTDAYDPSLQ